MSRTAKRATPKRSALPAAPAPVLAEAGVVPVLFLDANILLPQYLRSVFFDLADAGLAHVHWSQDVLIEVRRNLVSKRRAFNLEPAVADRLLQTIARAFPDAEVQGYEALIPRFDGTTDAKDAHVAAAALKLSQAIYAGQDVVLVTANTKHLPQAAFAGTSVRPAKPGPLLKDMLAANPDVANVLAVMLQRFSRPVVSKEDLLNILDASNCRAFATALAKAWGFQPR